MPKKQQQVKQPGWNVPRRCVVTGSSGFVGQRLVEMLIERGAERVIAVDVAPKPKDAWENERIVYVQGDIRNRSLLFEISKDIDCFFHNAAAVGPFHPIPLYTEINYHGTLNVIDACKYNKVPKLVFSSSPSTRFTGEDIDGLGDDELPEIPMRRYVQEYARTKAMAEVAVRNACSPTLMTIAVAPHQVYGPRDNLAIPNILEAAGTGRLRVFGNGKNKICYTHVDNYCHGLILGAEALYLGSPALGQFYIVTDGDTHPFKEGYALFWDTYEEVATGVGFASIKAKMSVPRWLLMFIAQLLAIVAWLVPSLAGKIKLTPFTVTMLTMHRWFDISRAERDLNYRPVKNFQEEWPATIEWFRVNWLPSFQESHKGMVGLWGNTQKKIDIQAGKQQ